MSEQLITLAENSPSLDHSTCTSTFASSLFSFETSYQDSHKLYKTDPKQGNAQRKTEQTWPLQSSQFCERTAWTKAWTWTSARRSQNWGALSFLALSQAQWSWNVEYTRWKDKEVAREQTPCGTVEYEPSPFKGKSSVPHLLSNPLTSLTYKSLTAALSMEGSKTSGRYLSLGVYLKNTKQRKKKMR